MIEEKRKEKIGDKMKVSETCRTMLYKFTEKEVVDMMVEAGFDAIDFNFRIEKYFNSDTDSMLFKEKMIDLKKYAESKGTYFNQAHAPYPSSKVDKKRTDEIFFDITRSMRNASYLGVKNIVVHPMQHLHYRDEGNPERLFELNMDFFNRLKPYCEEYGICVSIENMWQGMDTANGAFNIVKSVCSTPEEMIKYIDTLNSPCFNVCLDLGHAMLVNEDPSEYIMKLGKRLKALHVQDVDGVNDLHTFPYDGGAGDWDKIARALRKADYKGDFTMEVVYFLERLPKELYPSALKLVADSGKLVVSKIEKSE